METKLSGGEISVLHSLDVGQAGSAPQVRPGDIPKRLFDFHLVARQPSGEIVITKSGQRALFQFECIRGLGAVERGDPGLLGSGVAKWLAAAGFMEGGEAAHSARITARGRMWLASFEPEAAIELALPTAEQFARRRS